MAGVNRVILLGNLGIDPEVRTLESGTKVARVSLATTESYKDRNGERRDITEWHSVTFWRGLAEVVERYLNKGDQIYVEGKIRSRKYQDKEGNDRMSFDIVADNMTMLSKRSDSGGASSGGGQSGSSSGSTASEPINQPQEDDDLPF